jgi:hypothetical protein
LFLRRVNPVLENLIHEVSIAQFKRTVKYCLKLEMPYRPTSPKGTGLYPPVKTRGLYARFM